MLFVVELSFRLAHSLARSWWTRSSEAIVDALHEILGMNDVVFLDAYGELEDEEKAEAFVAMDVDERKI
ncbi:unnamed protein product [Linum trigynum]|uniref:Uncharacterized protein n=1 Tax=Linum trigynum TaxID=586398 RepID=A0AAV2FTV2_9ROSI